MYHLHGQVTHHVTEHHEAIFYGLVPHGSPQFPPSLLSGDDYILHFLFLPSIFSPTLLLSFSPYLDEQPSVKTFSTKQPSEGLSQDVQQSDGLSTSKCVDGSLYSQHHQAL